MLICDCEILSEYLKSTGMILKLQYLQECRGLKTNVINELIKDLCSESCYTRVPLALGYTTGICVSLVTCGSVREEILGFNFIL